MDADELRIATRKLTIDWLRLVGTLVLSAASVAIAVSGLLYTSRTADQAAQDAALRATQAAADASARVAREIEVQQQDLSLRQATDRRRLLTDLGPKILGATGDLKNCALVLDTWEAAFPGEHVDAFETVCRIEAPAHPSEASNWSVVGSSHPDLQSACQEIKRVKELGFSGRIYRNGKGGFRIAIGEYGTKEEADRDAVAIRAQLTPGAFAVDVTKWFKAAPVDCGPAAPAPAVKAQEAPRVALPGSIVPTSLTRDE